MPLDDGTIATLLERAHQVTQRAYVPYSHFPVGAALLTEDGSIFSGCNIENASYGLTVCAERVAIFQAVAAGHQVVRAIAVVAPRAHGVTPCGACRQVLYEFAPRDSPMVVILEGENGPDITDLPALLPRSFGPADLEGSSS